MMQFTIFIFSISMLILNCCDCNVTVRYDGLTDCHGKKGTNFILSELSEVSDIDCARACELTFRCLLVFYNSETKICTMHTRTLKDISMKNDVSSSCSMANDIAESWVQTVIRASSSFWQHPGSNMIGPPDYKVWGHSIKAFAKIRFAIEMYINQIHVYEDHSGGAVSGVSLQSPTSAWISVWISGKWEASPFRTQGQIFSPELIDTFFKTSTVRIDIKDRGPVFAINAVKIIGKNQRLRL